LDENTKFFVTDIDGTVTKSDIEGFLYPLVGIDWTQNDVAKLYSDISENGYQIIYLSGKTFIAQDSVKGYLKGINQGIYLTLIV